MKRALLRQLFSVWLVLLLFPLHADDKTDDIPKYHFFGESLILYLTLPGTSGMGTISPERNIYPLGVGGSIMYETTLLNRLFSDKAALPGILIGCSASIYMMEPRQSYANDFGALTIITLGFYSGYEFLIPITDSITLLPILAAGVRYYISLHFFMDELSVAYNPIVIGRAGAKLLFNKTFSLLAEIEYQVFAEYLPRQTLSISFGSGVSL